MVSSTDPPAYAFLCTDRDVRRYCIRLLPEDGDNGKRSQGMQVAHRGRRQPVREAPSPTRRPHHTMAFTALIDPFT
jgi:hypothetical protein